VTDADVDDAIKRIADQNRSFAAKGEGAKAEPGDRVTVSFKGSIDARRSMAGPANIPVVIGSNTFIPGFEEQTAGHDGGRDAHPEGFVPEDYNQYGTGRKAGRIRNTATLIEAPQETRIDDEFAQDARS